MNKVIKENIKNVLICALEDEPEHNELKYWFIPREEVGSIKRKLFFKLIRTQIRR